MTTIDLNWLSDWAATKGLETSAGRLLTISYRESTADHLVIPLDVTNPPDPVSLSHALTNLHPDDRSRRILWARQTGIWGDENEAIASEAFRSLLIAHNGNPESRGAVFGPSEFVVLSVFVLLMLVVGWDAYLLPESGDFVCFVSHDQKVEIAARSNQTLSALTEEVSGWKPVLRPAVPRLQR